MSIRGLLVQTCTVVHRGPASERDSYGIARFVETGRDENVVCRIDQLTTTEEIVGRDTTIATHRGLFLPDQPLSWSDRVEQGGVVYELTGDPDVMDGRRSPHHIEAALRTVEP